MFTFHMDYIEHTFLRVDVTDIRKMDLLRSCSDVQRQKNKTIRLGVLEVVRLDVL